MSMTEEKKAELIARVQRENPELFKSFEAKVKSIMPVLSSAIFEMTPILIDIALKVVDLSIEEDEEKAATDGGESEK